VKLFAATILAIAALSSGCATRHEAISTPLPDTVRDMPLPDLSATPLAAPSRAAVPVAAPPSSNETQVGRYTTVTTQPAEADANPMAVVAKVHFPREVVTTVGDAVRYVLIRTGYQLVADDGLDPRVKAVFGLRLPDNQRVLGPYRVDAILGTLMGQPYQLVADPGSRTVTYVAPSAPTSAPARAPTPAATGPVLPSTGA